MIDFEQAKIIKEQIEKDNAHEFVRSLIMAYCTNTQRMSELLEKAKMLNYGQIICWK